jgi:cell division protein FtsW
MGIDKNIRGIIVPLVILICIGILMVYSSSALISKEKYGSSFHYLLRHLINVLIGLIAMISMVKIDYHKLKAFVIPCLLLSIVLLIVVFLPGIGVAAGAKSDVKRWINLGFFTFQPSEVVKLSIVLFLSDYISKNAHNMKNLRRGVIIPLTVVAVYQGIILLQPDFGTVMSIGILSLTLLFVGGIRWKYLFCAAGALLPVVAFIIISAPYRVTRVLCFLNPWREPQGCGFQLIQSFIAFGRGGITGVGIGSSKQKLFFLPEAHTDFIFSLVGEEAGLIGALIVLAAFFYLLLQLFKVTLRTDDVFGYYLALGLTLMIGAQALINLAVSLGLMPTKGLPLPFISYGGSAFLVNMAAVGILLNIAGSSGASLPSKSIRLIPETRYRVRLNSSLHKNRIDRKHITLDPHTLSMSGASSQRILFAGVMMEKST